MPSGATGGQQRKQGVWRAHEVPAGRVPGAIAVPGRHVPIGTLFSSLSSLNSTLLGHRASRPFCAAAHGYRFATVQTCACTAMALLPSADRPPCGTHGLVHRAHTQQTLYFMLLPAYAVSYLAAAATPPSLVYVLCFHKAHDISRCRRRTSVIFGLPDTPLDGGAAGKAGGHETPSVE